MRPKPRPRPLARRRPPRPRPLLALRRRPRLWWAAVALLAATTGWTVWHVVAEAEARARAWDAGRATVIATRDLRPGERVEPGDVRLVQRPGHLVPAGVLRELPTGQVVRDAVYAGEALVASRLAPVGLSGVAALLARGERAVAVPVEPGTAPPLEPGDRVDVLVALPPEEAGGGPPGLTLTSGALVVDVAEHAVTVAVPATVAPRVAAALALGAVSLALVGA